MKLTLINVIPRDERDGTLREYGLHLRFDYFGMAHGEAAARASVHLRVGDEPGTVATHLRALADRMDEFQRTNTESRP
jgi:hypothetical protein